MDLTGKKQAALEAQLDRERKTVRELRDVIDWMLANASEDRLIAWVQDALSHIPERPAGMSDEPDWEQRVVKQVRHLFSKTVVQELQIKELEKEVSALRGEQASMGEKGEQGPKGPMGAKGEKK